jgi:predicted nucleotidyltransferase
MIHTKSDFGVHDFAKTANLVLSKNLFLFEIALPPSVNRAGSTCFRGVTTFVAIHFNFSGLSAYHLIVSLKPDSRLY